MLLSLGRLIALGGPSWASLSLPPCSKIDNISQAGPALQIEVPLVFSGNAPRSLLPESC